MTALWYFFRKHIAGDGVYGCFLSTVIHKKRRAAGQARVHTRQLRSAQTNHPDLEKKGAQIAHGPRVRRDTARERTVAPERGEEGTQAGPPRPAALEGRASSRRRRACR